MFNFCLFWNRYQFIDLIICLIDLLDVLLIHVFNCFLTLYLKEDSTIFITL